MQSLDIVQENVFVLKKCFCFVLSKKRNLFELEKLFETLLKLSEIRSFLNFSRELSLSSRCFAADHQLWKWAAKQGNYHSSQPYLYQKAKAVTLKKCQLTCTVGNLRGFFLPGNFFFFVEKFPYVCSCTSLGAHMSKATDVMLEILLPLVSFRGN